MPVTTTKAAAIRVHIRWMIRRDMDEVVAIERESFDLPWFEEDFIRCLRSRNSIGMIAEHGERVLAFMVYELHKNRLEVLNFAVAVNSRGRGIGRQLIYKLIGKLSSQRRTCLAFNIHEDNLPAHLFLRKMGFLADTALVDDSKGRPGDAYRFTKHYDQEYETPCVTFSTPELVMSVSNFPTVKKIEPVYRDEAGELHQRVLQKDAVKDPEATRAECGGKVIWIKPLATK